MSIAAKEKRAVYASLETIAASRLDDGQDVVLVECTIQRRAAVSRGSEGDSLARDRWIWPGLVVGGDKSIDIDQLGRIGGLPRGGGTTHVGLVVSQLRSIVRALDSAPRRRPGCASKNSVVAGLMTLQFERMFGVLCG